MPHSVSYSGLVRDWKDKMMYVIDLFVTISRRNDIVVPMPCYDIIAVRSP